MKIRVFFFFLMLVSVVGFAQKTTTVDRPKLVVGVIVDQMRYDFLIRFYDKYGDEGFKRIMDEGFNCENAHYNYIPTKTAVGHASVYTGTTGSMHGVISNNWYDKYMKKSIYCVDDFNYKAVGTDYKGEQKSPYRMKTTTLTDELRLAQNMKGKTIAMGLKDRSAVLPGGHTANAAYWFLGKSEGKFITSEYYMNELPDWVKKFNKSGVAKNYMKQKWETLYPIKTYTESIEDDNPYEGLFKGKDKPTFPYDLKKLSKENGGYDMIKSTPFGNTILVDFAKEAVKHEKLGKRDVTDFLAISFSTPDYIGHQFGVDSKEIQDNYLRLDKDLADLMKFLDKEIGEGEYTLFLTADHAAIPVPGYLKSQKAPGDYYSSTELRADIKSLANQYFGSEELIEYVSNWQIFLNKEELDRLKLDRDVVADKLAQELIFHKDVYKVVTAKTLQTTEFTEGIMRHLQKGYNQKYSGDVMMIMTPGNTSYSRTGSTHGSGYTYDTHVPIMFYGKGVQKGKLARRVEITDIAPTMSVLLQVVFPSGNSGKVIEEVLD